jgi:hypothetical protein
MSIKGDIAHSAITYLHKIALEVVTDSGFDIYFAKILKFYWRWRPLAAAALVIMSVILLNH